MSKTIRFGAYLREINIKQRPISYTLLSPQVAPDAQGRYLPYQPTRLRLRPVDSPGNR